MRSAGYTEFRHTPHLDRTTKEGLRLLCTACHIGQSKGKNSKNALHFSVTPNNCFPCHNARVLEDVLFFISFPTNSTCKPCHPDSRLLQTKVGHKFLRDTTEQVLPAGLIRDIPCWLCHPLYSVSPPPVESQSCEGCHSDDDVTDSQCQKYHHRQKELGHQQLPFRGGKFDRFEPFHSFWPTDPIFNGNYGSCQINRDKYQCEYA